MARIRLPWRPSRRAVVAGAFGIWLAGTESAKVLAGFADQPSTAQLWFLAAVASSTAALGWITAPGEPAGAAPSKKTRTRSLVLRAQRNAA